MEICFCVPAPHQIILTEWDVIERLFLPVLNPLSCSIGYIQWISISSLNSFSKKKHPVNDVRIKTNDVFNCLDSNTIDPVLLLWKTMKIKVWDFPLNLERRWFKEGRSLDDQRSPLDQIKIELEPSQITGPQFRLGKPFSLPGGCPQIALKMIFHIIGSRWRLPTFPY